jgi:AcrR family transcriptional regulator
MSAIRKKQPEIVRFTLLKEALRILQLSGMQGLTLEAVAKQAGVSKGGLLHHFHSKQALIEGMVSHVFEVIETQIEKSLQSDTVTKGRFTRAYVDVMNMEDGSLEYLNSIPLTTLMFEDELIRQRWREWLASQLKKHTATDSSESTRLVRLAADGLWFSGLLQYDEISIEQQQQLIEKLKRMTLE